MIKFCMNDMIHSFSYALDCVEHDLIGVTTYHGLRVSFLCTILGIELGFSKKSLSDLAACAILHDNALTEYIYSEKKCGINVLSDKSKISLKAHCEMGQRNLENIPFQSDISNVILYHHENANGTGPFRKKSEEVPLAAQLIHLADQLDSIWNLKDLSSEKYERMIHFVKSQRDKMFSSLCVNAFMEVCTLDILMKLNGDIQAQLNELLPRTVHNFSEKEIIGMCNMFASIIDYKSNFTKSHSLGVAKKSAAMGKYYGYSKEHVTKLYFSGAVHDIGKLVVDRDILEKPDKLTDSEFTHMKTHAYHTYVMLSRIPGLEDITRIASLHHEKLDGSGYPFGKCGNELSHDERLMACIDIYQALTEQRPYKRGFTHDEAIQILRKMGNKGLLDPRIIEDIYHAFLPSISNPSN